LCIISLALGLMFITKQIVVDRHVEFNM
jgi:hypothetical protein